MPSIRIKGDRVYSSLEDAISTNDDTLQGEPPGSSPNTYLHAPNEVKPRVSLPLLPRELLDVPSSVGRPRSSTASSRIHAHCINASRNPHYLQPPPNPLGNTSMPSNVNVTIATGSISLFGTDEDSVHHHDDVVEHLDVIGISPFFSHSNFK